MRNSAIYLIREQLSEDNIITCGQEAVLHHVRDVTKQYMLYFGLSIPFHLDCGFLSQL